MIVLARTVVTRTAHRRMEEHRAAGRIAFMYSDLALRPGFSGGLEAKPCKRVVGVHAQDDFIRNAGILPMTAMHNRIFLLHRAVKPPGPASNPPFARRPPAESHTNPSGITLNSCGAGRDLLRCRPRDTPGRWRAQWLRRKIVTSRGN